MAKSRYNQNKFHLDKRLKYSHETIKVIAENINSKISDIPHSNIFADISRRVRELKEKNKQMGIHQIKKLLHT